MKFERQKFHSTHSLFSGVSFGAVAGESSKFVHALSSVITRDIDAFVDVRLAEFAGKTIRALAIKRVDEILAYSTIFARIGHALIDFRLARPPCVSRQATARVMTIWQVGAAPAVVTRIVVLARTLPLFASVL